MDNVINQITHLTLLNEITLGQTITDPINRMITITEIFLIQSMLSRDIWDSDQSVTV